MNLRLLALLPLCFTMITACSEDDEAPATSSLTGTNWTLSSVTCDGSSASTTTTAMTFSFGSNETTLGLGGVSVSPLASCTGVYILSNVSFSDGTFAYTRPGAAFSCTDIDSNTVTSCDVSGIQCDTGSSDPSISTSGTYTQSSTELVVTYTSEGESFCSSGQEEVVTLTPSS